MSPAFTAVGKSRHSDWPKHIVLGALILIELLPLYMMAQISLKNNAQFNANPWLPAAPGDWNWENWRFAFHLVTPYLANTVLVAVSTTFGTLSFALLAAYFFARYRMPCSGVLWSVFMVLMMLPGIANLIPLFTLLKELSLLNTLWALIAVGTAGGQVFNLFVLRNFVEELPRDLFEAAEIDGAGHFQQLRQIVLPLTGSILGTLGILTLLQQWNEFLLPLIRVGPSRAAARRRRV